VIATETLWRYREAVAEDVPRLVTMLRTFVTSTKYRKFVGASDAHLETFLTSLIGQIDRRVFVAEKNDAVVGMIGVLAYVHPMSGELCAGELFWWLDPEQRGAGGFLLRRAEKWARSVGAVSLQMIAPADKPRVAAMYERLGYEHVESMYHVRLT